MVAKYNNRRHLVGGVLRCLAGNSSNHIHTYTCNISRYPCEPAKITSSLSGKCEKWHVTFHPQVVRWCQSRPLDSRRYRLRPLRCPPASFYKLRFSIGPCIRVPLYLRLDITWDRPQSDLWGQCLMANNSAISWWVSKTSVYQTGI